ncbi:MAG: hypothetical protein L0Z52_00075 [Acidobacteria bacterium]|nr:hypothetical protein [Acidobacteriota bacterium]
MKSSSSESGHLLLALMIGLTVMAIFLTVVAQQWSTLERRENEKELVFRGNQYIKAIKKYQQEHGGAYPTRLEALMELGPRRLRYIRKLYRDPMAPDGKWGILLADPSGKGFINPNAPPAEEGVPGLEDLGKGFTTSLEEKIRNSNFKNEGRRKLFAGKGGFSDWDNPDEDSEEGKESVTAPGQPTGPIVGVVSLWDLASFKRYHEHENYTEWTFSIFDLLEQQQQQNNQQPGTAAPTPGFGVGPGGSQTIMGGDSCCGPQCPPGSKCGDRMNAGSNK